MSSLLPSPFCCAKYCIAALAPPPARLTTTIGTVTSFSVVRMFWMMRAVASTPLPGAVGTMNSTGRCGLQGAAACAAAAARAASRAIGRATSARRGYDTSGVPVLRQVDLLRGGITEEAVLREDVGVVAQRVTG